MADLKLTASGDLEIERDSLVLIDGVDAVAQDLLLRLRFFKGEWFLDTRLGMPYFQKLLGVKPNASVVKNIFRTAIQNTPGVLTINDLSVDYNGQTRAVRVGFRVQAEDGELVFNKDLIV